MKSKHSIKIFVSNIIFCLSIIIFFSCKQDDVVLHGDLTGIVTDAETSEPIQEASVILKSTNDSTRTDTDGSYLLKNLVPGNYEMQVSKSAYASVIEDITVESAETKNIDFALNKLPVPSFSSHILDFKLDLTYQSFAISNVGKGKFTYVITPGQDWITVYPSSGTVETETDSITVTINRTGLSEKIYEETIEVVSTATQVLRKDIIHVYLNGLLDKDGNYYKVVKIGTQIWMGENLNTGTRVTRDQGQTDNNVIEKYCYDNNLENCDIYGGLYTWEEMMQYNPADSGAIGTTQGICPDGWHIPSKNEWFILVDHLGGDYLAGGKLKDTIYWSAPNEGATNESGFSGLPGGEIFFSGYENLGTRGHWWSSTIASVGSDYPEFDYTIFCLFLCYDNTRANCEGGINPVIGINWWYSLSVRCVKNP